MNQNSSEVNSFQVEVKDGRVNGRDVWKWLESKKDYSSWVKEKIKYLNLRLDIDYWSQSPLKKSGRGGLPRLEYYFTIETSKKLGMIANTERGNQIRDYFLFMEEKAKESMQQPKQLSNAQFLLQMAQQAVDQENRLSQVEQKLENIEQNQKQATEQLLALPEPQVEARKMTDRALIRQAVNSYAGNNNMQYDLAWRKLYSEIYYRLRINVMYQAKRKKCSALDILEQENLMTEVYAIACEIFKK